MQHLPSFLIGDIVLIADPSNFYVGRAATVVDVYPSGDVYAEVSSASGNATVRFNLARKCAIFVSRPSQEAGQLVADTQAIIDVVREITDPSNAAPAEYIDDAGNITAEGHAAAKRAGR